MTSTRKVVWAEGILLTQQHFQQWEYYHNQQHNLLMNALKSHAWGVSQLFIDEDLLSNGIFLIQKCKIIFRDGKVIQYDAAIDPPLSYQLKTNVNQQIDLYLCLPLGHRVANISGYPTSNNATTWHADYQIVSDENDYERQYEVLLARPQLIICSSDESRELYDSIKVAEIISLGSGKFQMSNKYLPPLLEMNGSVLLSNACARWIENINVKCSMLRNSILNLRNKNAESNRLEYFHLLLLQMLTNAVVTLRYQQVTNVHPEKLYNTLLALIGSLSIFDYEYDITGLPNYNHANLYDVFIKLEDNIKILLTKAMPSPVRVIMLNKIHDNLYVAEDIDNQFFDKHHFYLGVKRESSDKQWIEQFQFQIKLSAFSTIKLIAALAVAGVKMNYTQRLPHKLSIKPGFEYFYIEQSGEAWQEIKQERSLAVFLPYALSNASIELITMVEQ